MFRRPTVIIVGAGCSAEYGMPVGDVLKDDIADQLALIGRLKRENGFSYRTSRGADDLLVGAIQAEGAKRSRDDLEAVASSMADGIRNALSIDRYLHFHKEDEAIVAIGKLAISWAIIHAERKCLLGRNKVDLSAIQAAKGDEPHWLRQLFNILQDDVQRSDIADIFKNLTIITFNYDRLIEHYLFNAVQSLGRYTPKETADALSSLKIVHPYGKIGRLPWQTQERGPMMNFGGDNDMPPALLMESASRLRTFTETVEDEDIISAIHGNIYFAKQIVVLGFSYLQQNLNLMQSADASRAEVVEATCYGESDANKAIADRRLRAMLRGEVPPDLGDYSVRWHTKKAGQFLREFGNEIAS